MMQPILWECCAITKRNVQKHTQKLSGQGNREADSAGVSSDHKHSVQKHTQKLPDLGDQGAQSLGLLCETKTPPRQNTGRHKHRFHKHEVKVNIEFTDACKNHASGTAARRDLQ